MKDKVFLDSNILVYCYSTSDIDKLKIARTLTLKENVFISTQVLNETINVLSKKYHISWVNLVGLVDNFENNFNIHTLSSVEIKNGCNIAEKYGFSFYDSLIISSALKCNCNILKPEFDY